MTPASFSGKRGTVYSDTAPPCEKTARTIRFIGMPRSPSRAISCRICTSVSRKPARSSAALRSNPLRSYQARMGMPPLMVTGRTGALGKTKRHARSPGRTISGTMGSKSCPSAPRPCSQITAAFGLGSVSTSIVSSMFSALTRPFHGVRTPRPLVYRNRPQLRRACDPLDYDRHMRVTLEHLRRYAIARSLFKPTTLGRAIAKLGFVQADPIRAPARAQDLTLRHRVAGYRAGDLERLYPKLALEEDFFVNYGYLPRANHQLMHPRTARTVWTAARAEQAAAVLAFVRARGAVHPREVDAHFAHGKVSNWFGGSSNASTQLLDVMHYRGLLRVARREGGTRIYAARKTAAAPDSGAALDTGIANSRMDALVDVVVHKYAPLPASSLGQLVGHLRGGAPQWTAQRAE